MKTSEYKDRINEVINHIHDNLDTSLTIDVLSGIAFLSQSHFKKIFKAVSGENISDYVKRARLEKAQYMLLHNQHRSITDIALETGFSSSASFARAFGRYFGISASDFRRDNLNESIIHFGTPFLRNISPEEYKGCETVYAVADDGRGAYYFGSEFGEMYIFNNDKFEKIKFPELEDVLSLAFDEEDTLWIGSVGQFGYAERDDEGIFRFVSLADRLPEKERSFNQVWKIVVTPVGIYFQTPSAIFRWYDNVLTFVKTDTSYHSLTYVNEKLYLLEFREGLLSLDGMELKREPGADQMNEEHLAVYNFLPYDEEYIFCLSRNKGCYLYNGKNFIQFSTEVDHLFEEAGLLRSVYIPRVGYAIGTRTMGIIIINKEGKLVSSVNRKRGLLDNYIRALHCTRDGTLLMGMMYGIALLNVGLPVMIFSEDSGISTMIKSVRRYRGTLYLATHYGIALEKHNYRSGEEIFRRIPDIITQAHDLVESNDSLCVAYGFGLYFIRGEESQDFNLDVSIRALCLSSSQEDTIYAASNNKIFRFHFLSGQWHQGQTIEGLSGRLSYLVEDARGRLFCNGPYGTVYRISYPESETPEIKCYGKSEGLPETPIGVFNIKGEILLSTHEGILRYDADKDIFKEDSPVAEMFQKRIVHELYEDGDRLWIIEGRSRDVYCIHTNSENISEVRPFISSPDFRAITIYPEGNGVTWIGCHNQLIRCDMKEQEKVWMQ